jgi:hypothetical protein
MTDHVIDTNFDRVTSILFPFSGLTKVDPTVLQKAADRGTSVHLAADCIINGLPYDVSPEHQGYVDSFNQWVCDAEGEGSKHFLAKPARLYDQELMITGECDGLYEMHGKITLYDLKTSAKEGSTWCLQGSAYAHMARKQAIHIDRVEFVKLHKNGKAKSFIYDENMDEFILLNYVYKKYFKGQIQNLTDF